MVCYENVLFVQGENADEIIECFQEYSGLEFIEYVLDLADPYGDAQFEQSDTQPWGSRDDVYTLNYDGDIYIVSINWGIPYIGVHLRVED